MQLKLPFFFKSKNIPEGTYNLFVLHRKRKFPKYDARSTRFPWSPYPKERINNAKVSAVVLTRRSVLEKLNQSILPRNE